MKGARHSNQSPVPMAVHVYDYHENYYELSCFLYQLVFGTNECRLTRVVADLNEPKWCFFHIEERQANWIGGCHTDTNTNSSVNNLGRSFADKHDSFWCAY